MKKRQINLLGNFLLFTILTISSTSTQAQTPPTIYVAGDGSGDYNCDGNSDQIEINQALDFVAANAAYTTIYLKGSNIVIDEPVIISSNTTLTGDLNAQLKLKDYAGWWAYDKPMIAQKNRVR